MTFSLILGGARSGKSRRALILAEAASDERCFVATAEAYDEEMELRIRAHRRERGPGWRTVEAPREVPDAVREAPPGALVVDCLTLWLSNMMLAEYDVAGETEALLAELSCRDGPTFLVSNEVGFGLVPDTPLGRAFRDEQGRLNQRLAAEAAHVELVVAGLPLAIKG